jgi:muramoyltetrapeptide carboxypeptidase LdcA involved in peptidoglycan recycling
MMLNLKKPRNLKPGSRIAIVSPSWGGPSRLPARYEMGVRELRERFGFDVVEMPHARADATWIWRNPQARADDINAAFADSSIEGIFTSIGGDDSVRILPYLDPRVIRDNPKVFLGFSDTTTLHTFCLLAGLQTFYGPSVMAGIAENGGMFGYTESWLRKVLMSSEAIGELKPSSEWTADTAFWEGSGNDGKQRGDMQRNAGWKWLQGDKRVEGHLVGGCLDVFEFFKGTQWWPGLEVWDGAVFYWETSEDAPSPNEVTHWLRNYGMLGILDKIVAMVVGRPAGYTAEQRDEVDKEIVRVVAEEFGRGDMPIVTGLDFGHTSPQMVIPNGGRMVIDPGKRTISLPEGGTV